MKRKERDRGECEAEPLTGDEVNSIWISSSGWSSWITVISFSLQRHVATENDRDRGKGKASPLSLI